MRVWAAALLGSAIFVCSTHTVYAEPSFDCSNAAPGLGVAERIDEQALCAAFDTRRRRADTHDATMNPADPYQETPSVPPQGDTYRSSARYEQVKAYCELLADSSNSRPFCLRFNRICRGSHHWSRYRQRRGARARIRDVHGDEGLPNGVALSRHHADIGLWRFTGVLMPEAIADALLRDAGVAATTCNHLQISERRGVRLHRH